MPNQKNKTQFSTGHFTKLLILHLTKSDQFKQLYAYTYIYIRLKIKPNSVRIRF